jgi:hypothetical protein
MELIWYEFRCVAQSGIVNLMATMLSVMFSGISLGMTVLFNLIRGSIGPVVKQIKDIATQQDKLPGQKRTKIVSDFKYPVLIAQFLKDLDFQYTKIQSFSSNYIKIQKTVHRSRNCCLQQIQERYHKNVNDVIDTLDLVR